MKSDRLPETVLFTDIVGSTERAVELGDRSWRELLKSHDRLVRRELERCGGREVNTIGDGFVAVFRRPAQAIQCACSIRDAVRSLGIEIRSGLHTGEVDLSGKAVGGIAVHIGSRVSRIAQPSEVLVSSTVHDLVSGSGFTFEERGTHALKGVPGEWRLYVVSDRPARLAARGFLPRLRHATIEGDLSRHSRSVSLIATLTAVALLLGLLLLEDSSGRGERSAKVQGASPGDGGATVVPSGIAVLPFNVKGPDPEGWMREGMVDLFSTNLDGVAGLRAVASRTVLARWRERVGQGESPDLNTTLEVARQTGARYALVGSATGQGQNVRLAAEIFDLLPPAGSSGREDGPGEPRAISLGKRQIEGRATDVIELVDRLSVEILGAVPKLDRGDGERLDLARITTASPTALKAFLEAEAAYRRSDFDTAVTAYRRAVEADSTFVLALYRLAVVYPRIGVWQPDLADNYLDRAVRLSDRLPYRDRRRAEAQLAFGRNARHGLELLRLMTVNFPADAEAWYQFGEACHVHGAEALADPSECDQALGRAVELDSTFTPPYRYLIENSFNHTADSTRAAKLIAAFGRLARDGDVHRWDRVAFALTFGDSMARAQVQPTLDTLSLGGIHHVVGLLQHPASRPHQELVLLSRSRRNDPEGAGIALALFFNHFARGRSHSAIQHLDRAVRLLGPASAVLRSAGLYTAFLRGMPVDLGDLEKALELEKESPDLVVFFAGGFAADRRRWGEHRSAVLRLQDRARRLLAEGDSTGARYVEGVAQALHGYGQGERGRVDEAVKLLTSAQSAATGRSPFLWEIQGSAIDVNSTIRFWLGSLLLENGRAREAEPYFRSFWQDPALPNYYLGKIYEELERFGDAREAYEFFALGWRDAEPELQILVEEARAAGVRLASVIRE